MKYAKRQPGQSNEFIDSASMWNDIFDLLNAFQSGQLQPSESVVRGESQVSLVNTSGSDRDVYEVLQIERLAGADMPATALSDAFHSRPTLNAIDPVWHTDIDNLVVVPGVIDGGVFKWQARSWAVVKVTVEETTDSFVMLDPSNVNQMKTSDTGPWKIIALDTTNDLAVVDLTKGSNLWRYELKESTQSPNATDAKLLRLDGTEFAASIDLLDPDDKTEGKTTGYQGWCNHVGNAFYDIAGPCDG